MPRRLRPAELRAVRFTSETLFTMKTTVSSGLQHERTWSTRRISASYTTGGPLTSHPTTQFQPVSVTRSPATALFSNGLRYRAPVDTRTLGQRRDNTIMTTASGHLTDAGRPGDVTDHPDSLTQRHHNMLSKRRAILHTPPPLTASRLPFQDENASPICSNGLSINHRDSLELPTTKMVPKLPQEHGHCEVSPTPRPKPRSSIPRTRTLGVLSNITASISRTSLGMQKKSGSRKSSASSRHASGSSTTTQSSLVAPLGPAGGGMASGLAISLPCPSFEEDSESSYRDPRHIYSAQSSEYWSGRFMTLNDRFMSESLPAEISALSAQSSSSDISALPMESPTDSQTKLAPSSGQTRRLNIHRGSDSWTSAKPVRNSSLIPHLGTMPTLHSNRRVTYDHFSKTQAQVQIDPDTTMPESTSNRANTSRVIPLEDEDVRCRRVFQHLETMCKTSEARKSLRAWQQAYARRVGKENLLPAGGSMEDRGWVGRLLSSSTSVSKGLVHASAFHRRKRSSVVA